jgi:hypothetical protein
VQGDAGAASDHDAMVAFLSMFRLGLAAQPAPARTARRPARAKPRAMFAAEAAAGLLHRRLPRLAALR